MAVIALNWYLPSLTPSSGKLDSNRQIFLHGHIMKTVKFTVQKVTQGKKSEIDGANLVYHSYVKNCLNSENIGYLKKGGESSLPFLYTETSN